MRIGIIGAGNMGATLAAQLTRLGHQVAIANSRGPQTLTGVAAQTSATPATTSRSPGTDTSTPSTPACPKANGCKHSYATRWSRRSTPSARRA